MALAEPTVLPTIEEGEEIGVPLGRVRRMATVPGKEDLPHSVEVIGFEQVILRLVVPGGQDEMGLYDRVLVEHDSVWSGAEGDVANQQLFRRVCERIWLFGSVRLVVVQSRLLCQRREISDLNLQGKTSSVRTQHQRHEEIATHLQAIRVTDIQSR